MTIAEILDALAPAFLVFVVIFGSNAIMTWRRGRQKPTHFGDIPMEKSVSPVMKLEESLKLAKHFEAAGWNITHMDTSQLTMERDGLVLSATAMGDGWVVRVSGAYRTLDVDAMSTLAAATLGERMPWPKLGQ